MDAQAVRKDKGEPRQLKSSYDAIIVETHLNSIQKVLSLTCF